MFPHRGCVSIEWWQWMDEFVNIMSYSAEWLLFPHEIDNECGRGNKEELHQCVVEWDEVHKKIEVPYAEH